MARKFKLTRRQLLWLLLAAIVFIFIAWLFYRSKGPSSSVIPSTKPTTTQQPTSTNSGSSEATSGTSSSNNVSESPKTPAATGNLISPYGTFVSNHRPSLSGAQQQKQEQSTCNTTSGAECYIKFTKNGVTKQLESQKTDANGAAVWNWNISDSGFTTGTWKVTAVATLNGQTKSVDDLINLEVQP